MVNPETIEFDLKAIVGGGYTDFWRSRNRYRIVKGGRASKKSTTAALWYIVNLIKHPAANLLCVRKVYQTHKDSTYAQLRWAMNRLGVSHLFTCRLSPLEIVYNATGQKILFRGLDDPMSITSVTVEKGVLCWVWFEEFYQIDKEQDFNMIDLSIRGEVKLPLFKQITGTLNTWSDKHWVKSRFFDRKDKNVFCLTTNYLCNEFLDKNDIMLFDDMKQRDPRRYKVEGLGEWGIVEGLVFDNWREEWFDKEQIIRGTPDVKSAFGLDFGYTTDPTAFIGILVSQKDREIYVFDEHYEKRMQNDQIATMLKMKGYGKERIVADSSEPKSIDDLRRMGINRIEKAKKGVDSVKYGIDRLKRYKIIVHPSCVNTIFELSNYSYRIGGKSNEVNDSYNHLMDALRYANETIKSTTKSYIL